MQEKSMWDFHISTYPFPHYTDFKHTLPSIFPCSCFFANQRSAGCPERRFLTGRWGGWASGRLKSFPILPRIPRPLLSAPHICLWIKVYRGTPTLLPYHHCLLNPVSSARQGRSDSLVGQKQAVTYPPPLSTAFSYLCCGL